MPRSVAFSSKQKKKQLQEKRNRKRDDPEHEVKRHMRRPVKPPDAQGDSGDEGDREVNPSSKGATRGHQSNKFADPDRYRLEFFRETKEEIQNRKELSRKPYEILAETALETALEDIYKPGSVLDIPKRPSWHYGESKQVLETKENKYFQTYLDNIYKVYSPGELSYFELNLETWRQLWRVLEISDVLLLIADIRHPALHFSPALYDHVTKDLGKHMILVLNKVDLAPTSLVIAWKEYFKSKFPKLHVIFFTSFPKFESEMTDETVDDPGKVLHKKRKLGKRYAHGASSLVEVCHEICRDSSVDLTSWQEKIREDMEGEIADNAVVTQTDEMHDKDENVDTTTVADSDSILPRSRFKHGILSIGCVGYPNVGKSSVINGLMGKKVVSVSVTPGHTKHLQTIYLTPSVVLCDCPGLVFPSLVDRSLQIISGIYPIAQVREPLSVVSYLAQRLDLPQLLRIQQPNDYDDFNNELIDRPWSAHDISEGWAVKCGFITARTAWPDIYRAANRILKLAVEARLRLCFRPPGFTQHKEYWSTHPDAIELSKLLTILGHRKKSNDSADDEQEITTEEDESSEDNSSIASDSREDEQNSLPKVQQEHLISTKSNKTKSNSKTKSKLTSSSNPFALLADSD